MFTPQTSYEDCKWVDILEGFHCVLLLFLPFLLYYCSELYFKHHNRTRPLSVRKVKAEHIGKLVMARGIVTRSTEVKPVICVSTYSCDQCGAESYQPVSPGSIKGSVLYPPYPVVRNPTVAMGCL